MPVIRFVRGTVYNQKPCNIGDEIEVTEREAFALVGAKRAERVDGKEMVVKASGMVTQDVIETRDPVAEHRDPAVQPAQRRK